MTITELINKLTKRELETLEHIVLSGSVKGASKVMNVSPRTIEDYIEQVKNKLGLQYKYQFNKIYIENFYQKIYEIK